MAITFLDEEEDIVAAAEPPKVEGGITFLDEEEPAVPPVEPTQEPATPVPVEVPKITFLDEEPQVPSIGGLTVPPAPERPKIELAAEKPSDSDVLRGLEVSMRQVPQLAYGVAGLVGATSEQITGYGEALRDFGFRGYKDWEQSIEPVSKETDDITFAWQRAKEGDLGALVDWAQYGIGYALGQLGETAAVSALGALAGGAAAAPAGPAAVPAAAGGAVLAAAGKTGFKALATDLVEKAIAKQAVKIAEEQAAKQGIKLTAEETAKRAASSEIKQLAGKEIGSNAAIFANSIGMELGGIYGEAESQARAEGRELTGVDLARIWGTGLAAGGLEGLTDKIGLDLLKGKLSAKLPAGRLAGAAVAGGIGILGEGLTETAQTALERAGAGKDVISDDAVNEYINAASLGALGGGVIGGAGGFISGNPKENAAAKAKVAAEASKTIAPETANEVAKQADAVINEAAQETPEQRVTRLKAEAQAAREITLEEEAPVSGLPPERIKSARWFESAARNRLKELQDKDDAGVEDFTTQERDEFEFLKASPTPEQIAERYGYGVAPAVEPTAVTTTTQPTTPAVAEPAPVEPKPTLTPPPTVTEPTAPTTLQPDLLTPEGKTGEERSTINQENRRKTEEFINGLEDGEYQVFDSSGEKNGIAKVRTNKSGKKVVEYVTDDGKQFIGDAKSLVPELNFARFTDATGKEGFDRGSLQKITPVAPTPEAAPAAVEPTQVTPPVTPQLEPLRRVARAEQTEEDVAGLVDSGFVEVYNGQPVITQAGLDALPEAERPRLTPEARKIQIDTRTSEAAAEAISKNLRIGVDQVPPDVRMPAGWTLVGDVYVPPTKMAKIETFDVEALAEVDEGSDVFADVIKRKDEAKVAVAQKPEGSAFATQEEFRAAFDLRGEGHGRFATRLDLMVADGVITSEGRDLIMAVIYDNNTDDTFLNNMEMGSMRARATRSYGLGGVSRQTVQSAKGKAIGYKPLLKMMQNARQNLKIDEKTAQTLSTFWHEFGHAGYYSLLDKAQKSVVSAAYKKTTKSQRIKFFESGVAAARQGDVTAQYYAKSETEWFAQSFAEYVLTQKSEQKALVPIFESILNKIKGIFGKLFSRKEGTPELNDIFEYIIQGKGYGSTKIWWNGLQLSLAPAVYGTRGAQPIDPDFSRRLVEREKQNRAKARRSISAPEVREARREPAITPQQDRDYLDAVERGDLDAAQAIVDQAAKDSGYQVLPLFHGTEADTIKKFRKKLSGIWLAFKKEAASPSSGERPTTIINAYADLGDNPITLTDEQAKEWQRSGSPLKWMRDFRLENRATAVIIGDYATVVFQPSQVKSADPVTRDDQGNIIPPSQRFQRGEADIRYARRERDPEVQKAAQDLKAGTIDRNEYQRIVDMRMPLRKFEAVPIPATNDDMLRGLGERIIKRKDAAGNEVTIKKQDLIQAPESIAEGTVLESRLDIPAYENADVWVVSLHEPRPNINKGNAGPVVAYTPTSVLRNVEFGVTEQAAVNIAAGKQKTTIATMKGEFVPMTAEQAYELANTNKEQWVEIGMNPVRHSYFYDKDTQTPVVSAEEVVQVGGMVLAKNPVFGKREDYLYARRVEMGRAGMDTSAVEARLQELGFPTGGIIRVVNEPDADFEGRTIILDGKVTGIELNASALKDNAAIDRVLNHEFAESANADGALNKLVERLTPKEKKEINDTITRLRYEERARTTEEAARAIEALAEAWKGRGFFTRAVARVEAWASKLGFKLTRRAAEYIAARNLAEVNENVRKWHIGEAMANIKGARRVVVDGVQAVLIPPSEMRVAYSIAAYHGTPHEIKGRFQVAKIGTGEGATAYGWGLYFAENIEVAKEYQRNLSKGQYALSYEGVPVNELPTDQKNAILKIAAGISRETVIADLETSLRRQEASKPEDWAVPENRERVIAELKSSIEEARKIKPSEIKPRTAGNLYRVELDLNENELLDWDLPLNEQSNFVRNALEKAGWTSKGLSSVAKMYGDSGKGLYDAIDDDLNSKQAASESLLKAGIKGIKYLDAGSRAEGGTYNYVVFDENLIKITGRNGQPVDIRESRREPEAIPTFTEGTPEAATLKEMATSMAKVDAASEAKGGKPETYKISEIASVWMDSGLGERELQDAIVEYTNLTPANAARVAKAIARQYDIQQSISTAFLETQTGLSVEALPEGVTLPKEVDPDRPKPVMQRLFEVFMGVRVPPTKITVNEKAALKDQIRLKAAANRAAKEAQKETAAAVIETIKQMELRGPVRPKQAQALAKRAANVIWTSDKSVEAFTEYAAKVVENTNYDADVREAKAAQKRAKELSKQKTVAASPQRQVLEDIGKISIGSIDDPRLFADTVNYYLRAFKKVTSPDYVVIPDSEMTSYLSQLENQEIDTNAERERVSNEKLAAQYGLPVSQVEALLNSQDIIRDLVAYAKREQIESILNQKIGDIQTALKAYDQNQLRPDQRKLVDSLLAIDAKGLDAKEKQSLIRIGNNVIHNNQTNGAQYFVAVANGQQNARQAAQDFKTIEKNRAWIDLIPTLGSKKVAETMRNWSLELQSVADTFRNIFGKESMAKIFRQMGMYNLDRGFTDAANTLDQIQEKMAEFYKKNTQKYKKAARDQNGILSEGVVGFLIQQVPAKGEAESIAQRRDLIKQDIANRRSSQQADKIEMANRIEEILGKVDGNTVEEILANMKANYRPNYDSLTYLMNDLLPQYKDFLKQFDENFNDQANNYDNPYYLPIAFIRSGPELEITPESESMFYEGMSLRPRQAANTIKRVDYSVLPKDKSGNPKEIQFNLRRGTYDSLSDQINKAYTNEAWQQIFSFMKTADADAIFGGRANKDFMAERLNRLRISRMRRGSANNGAIAKFADSVSVLARKIGTGIALGGVFQVFKQSPDQLISALGTTGRYDLLGEHVMTIGSAKKLLDKFSIGRRGDASSGYKYINQMEGAQNRLERAFTESRWSEVKENASKVADVWMLALKKTDFLCAAGAWMTYYRANLDKNGIKFEGWDKEAQLVDTDPSRQDAASYAEQMTDIYQGSSDPTKMATFAQSGKSGWENFVKAALVPFNSFAVQQRMRIYSDGRDSFTKAGETGALGRFGLASTIGGLVAFHTMRRLVLPTITGAGVYALYGMLGVDMDEPDDEKKKEEARKAWRQFQGELLANTLVGGAPQFVEAATIDAFNYANYLVSLQLESEDIIDDNGEIMDFAKYQKERSPFWRYQSFKNAPSFGMFDVGLGQADKVAVQTKQLMDREQMEMYTPEEQRLLYFSTLSEWLYLMRLNDADFARMVGKARRDMIKAVEEREKQIKAIREGR